MLGRALVGPAALARLASASGAPALRRGNVTKVTAHAMQGLLATLTTSRGIAGHLVAATLRHESERTTMHAYAAPSLAATGVQRRGLKLLQGGK